MKMFDYQDYKEQEELYLSKNKDLFVYQNPHPQNKNVGDCVKRAITIATSMDYKTVQLRLNRYKKITRSYDFNEDKNWVPFVEKELGAKKLSGYHNIKIGDFAKLNLKGKYIIRCRGHVTCIINGKVYDTWNCSFKAINRIWMVE
jgi:hypothetical protein